MTQIGYYLVYGLLWLISLLPFWLLYIVSDVLAWFVHSVIRYRRRVVRGNLTSSFPWLTDKELRRIERGFYRFLSDYAVETIKICSISNKTMFKRMKMVNLDIANEAMARGRNVSLLLGHYCNWEWVSSVTPHIDPQFVTGQIYHRLESKVMDKVFEKIRTHFKSHNIPMQSALRQVVEWKREGKMSMMGYIADQAPLFEIHLFLDFLNHDTGVYTGPERISRFLNAEVYYAHIRRPKRGYYELEMVPVTLRPNEEPIFSITREYFRLLEENIKEAPEYYLWSHKRWKRPRSAFEEHWGKEKAAEMLTHL